MLEREIKNLIDKSVTINVKSRECYVIGDTKGKDPKRMTVGGYQPKTKCFSSGRMVFKGLFCNELRFIDLNEAKKVAKLYANLYEIDKEEVQIGKSKKEYTLVNIKLLVSGQEVEGWVNEDYLYRYLQGTEKDPTPAMILKKSAKEKAPVLKEEKAPKPIKVDPKIEELKKMLNPSMAGGVKAEDGKFIVLTKKNAQTKKEESTMVIYSPSQGKIVDKFQSIPKSVLDKVDGNLFIFGKQLKENESFKHITQEAFTRRYLLTQPQRRQLQKVNDALKVEPNEAVFNFLKALLHSKIKRHDFGPNTTNMVLTEKHIGWAFIYGFGLSEALINEKLASKTQKELQNEALLEANQPEIAKANDILAHKIIPYMDSIGFVPRDASDLTPFKDKYDAKYFDFPKQGEIEKVKKEVNSRFGLKGVVVKGSLAITPEFVKESK